MSTTTWSDRPLEQARLLNPAFLGLLTWSCAKGYSSVDASGLPYALAFVSMPVVLHKHTREMLPKSTRTSLAAWLGENTQVQVGFADRARALVPLVKEGILFASSGKVVSMAEGRIKAAKRPRSMAKFEREATDEVNSCVKKAGFLGKWFANAGDYTTVMALWGVAP